MNNEQILELAKKNGAFQFDDIVGGICRNTEFHFTESELVSFAKELMQIQREKDAEICDDIEDDYLSSDNNGSDHSAAGAAVCVDAIRSL